MKSIEIVQLAQLMEALNALNAGEDKLYVGEATIFSAIDEPIAKIEYDDSGELCLKEIYSTE